MVARAIAAAVLAMVLSAPAAEAQQSRKDICDGDLRNEEQRIKAAALAKEKQVVDDAGKLGMNERVPQMRAALGRNLAFELSQARQNHEDCLKLP